MNCNIPVIYRSKREKNAYVKFSFLNINAANSLIIEHTSKDKLSNDVAKIKNKIKHHYTFPCFFLVDHAYIHVNRGLVINLPSLKS